MSTAGLWMLLVLGALIVGTGLPVWALLLGTSSLFAALGLAGGAFDWRILTALPLRLVGLLEHDLLQALPLYVFIGMLLQRVRVADALFSSFARLLRPLAGANGIAALAVGSLIAPMNGSVASSSALLARLLAPRLGHMAPARAIALVSVAATIGVVVPPSLVLILLGDAMLRAHTEASNLPGFALAGLRIINTQDVLHAALLPALLILVLWVVLVWRQARRQHEVTEVGPLGPQQSLLAMLSAGTILLLLAGVFSGRLFAVEAAASGGCLLLVATLLSRALKLDQWQEVLADTLALSGALFALLVGATTFSLVFRAFGTDRWLSDLVLSSGWPAPLTALTLLLFVALCAWVLDAFEMIFVIIPIVAPVLIAKLGDAQQAAVLLLLVLQLSFLIPPMGYAVLMARARAGLGNVASPQVWIALRPFVLAQCLVTALVFVLPGLVHRLDAAAPGAGATPAMSEQEIQRQMHEMAAQPPP